MDRFFAFPLDHLPFVALVLLISFTVHEFAHAYTAYRFGDPTAHAKGRVTLHPMAHLDLFGTLMLLLAGFGWAKPVPVNPSFFRRPRLMSVMVSFAGPFSNLVLAFIGVVLYRSIEEFGWLEEASRGVANAAELFLSLFIYLNTLLFLFNLIPLPPLDGYRILENFAPTRWREPMYRNEQWGMLIFLLIVFITPLNKAVLGPLGDLVLMIMRGMNGILQPIFG